MRMDRTHRPLLPVQDQTAIESRTHPVGRREELVRTVEPCCLASHCPAWYIWGWRRMREDFRLFKLNRMTELAAGEPFAIRSAPLPSLEPERVFPVKYQVTVLFDPSCRWRLVEDYIRVNDVDDRDTMTALTCLALREQQAKKGRK